jgi:thiamine-phosphate pyrophosphorylase
VIEAAEATRLFLVTPPDADPARFPDRLRAALSAADIAAVLIASEGRAAVEGFAAELTPIIQEAGAAALIADDTRLAGHARADGVQIGGSLSDLEAAIRSFHPKRIVGAANIGSRDEAMDAGEVGADYVFFGRPHGDTHDEPHPKAIELAGWWSEMTAVPGVLMAGRSLASIETAAATGAAFVAVNQAVWAHPAGPAEAVRLAVAAIRGARRDAA